jgi:tetratricopeptide (TPR) repeat protein
VRVALLVSLLLLPSLAQAAGAPPPAEDAAATDARRAHAKTRYEEGAAAYAAGRFKDAVDMFLAADRLAPSAPLSFNIARAYEKLGDDSRALRWYRDYLRRAPDAANASDVKGLVEKLEDRLSKKGVQQLSVMSTPEGATVSIDDRPVGVTPWTGDLLPGRHRVELSLRGFEENTLEVELAAHRSQDVSVALVARPDSSGAAPPTTPVVATTAAGPTPSRGDRTDESSGGLGIWPWVTLGAGGVALGGALTFELLRRGSESDAKGDDTQVGYKEKLDQMESQQTTARILAGVGGALVIAGGVLVVLDLGSSKDKPATALAVTPTPGGAFATARGHF